MRRSICSPRSVRRIGLAAAASVTSLALTACSGGSDNDPETSAGTTESSAPIVQPGRPGEAASTIDADDLPTASEWNHTDEMFAQMMIPHHGQALEMSRLAMEHAASPQVVALARRIEGTQGPEIVALATWLDERNLEVPTVKDRPGEFDHGEHGHTRMAGMLTEAQLAELERARGQRFDRLFLQRMIYHHRGAVEMAEPVGREGSDVLIAEMAADVTAVQTAEIARMRQMLRQL